ncbi:hypothetical protein PCASD_24811 [Puccinia coronata f. sp. avenae]|uniref:Uncharacterized protein n=1 Tax=Puccinia coronata f. sp. avenae TaxID=200324 RepID=A0A2N5S9H5_9BASI|nr:hypothetical protein PCASD_24811 [Puccinia coronata f. sp. avenae]
MGWSILPQLKSCDSAASAAVDVACTHCVGLGLVRPAQGSGCLDGCGASPRLRVLVRLGLWVARAYVVRLPPTLPRTTTAPPSSNRTRTRLATYEDLPDLIESNHQAPLSSEDPGPSTENPHAIVRPVHTSANQACPALDPFSSVSSYRSLRFKW